MKTIAQLADEAMQVQDACNLIAVANSFARVLIDLRTRLSESGQECGTDAIRNHPITRLWASKVYEMSGTGTPDLMPFSDAYLECEFLAQEERNRP